MPVPSPPRIPQSLDDVAAVAQALIAYQQWSVQLYNAIRPAVLQMERIAQVPLYEDPITNPPTQAQVTAIQARVNLIITAARTAVSGQ